MQLVHGLIGQLDGTIKIERERGTSFILEFAASRREEKERQLVSA